MNYKKLAKRTYIILLTVTSLVSCGGDTEEKKEVKNENMCDVVKQNECSDYQTDEEAEWIPCDSDNEDCQTFTEGEGKCQTTVTCELQYACNNSAGYVACPDGYDGVSTENEEDPQCTVGEGNCISVEAGYCSEAGTCDCSKCHLDEIEVAECGDIAFCRTIKSCETEVSCAPCEYNCNNNEDVVSSCDANDNTCRELACSDDATLKYFCKLR